MSAVLRFIEEDADRQAVDRLAAVRTRPVRSVRRLQSALSAALAPIVKEAGPSVATLESRWREMVGERLAQVTRPIRLEPAKKGAVLHIRAPSGVATVLQHASQHILARVSLAAGIEVRELRIVQTTSTAPASKAKKPLRPITAEERATLARDLVHIQDPILRAALQALGEAVLAAERDGVGRSAT